MSAANQLLGERYQFIQVLGASDVSRTLLVADTQYPGHPKCVVKQLKMPTRNPTTLKFIHNLLKKKVAVLETIGHHAQIPSILNAFEADSDFFIVQEFIPGRSLATDLRPGNPVSETQVLGLLRQVLEILAFVQQHGVVHGGLKPSNILHRQGDGKVILLDFALAKDVGHKVAGRELPQGSKPSPDQFYRPLEQRQGQARFASDHYALGMIAIQALTGLSPEELPDAEHGDIYQRIVSLLQEIPDLGINTASLLARMIHPNADRRYQKATEILVDLSHLSPPEPTALAADPLSDVGVGNRYALPPGRQTPWLLGGALGLTILAMGTGLMALRLPQRLAAAQHLAAAQAAAAGGDREGAIAQYTQVLNADPNHVQGWLGRGQLYAQQGETDAAIADLTTAIELRPNDATLYYERGNLRFVVGDNQGAIADYTQAIQQNPNHAKAYINRGTARADWGDDQGAIDDYTQALALEPPPEERAAAYLNRCLSYSNLGEHVQALDDCSIAIGLRPSHSLAYQNRGLVRRRLGDFQGSLQDYKIAIQLEPNSPEPYYNRGLTRQSLRDLPGAVADFTKAIALAPDHVFALHDRGLVYRELGQSAAALADFQQAAQRCLDLGRVGCYEDAQYEIQRLETGAASP